MEMMRDKERKGVRGGSEEGVESPVEQRSGCTCTSSSLLTNFYNVQYSLIDLGAVVLPAERIMQMNI